MVNSYSFSGMFSSITQTRAHQVRRNRRKIFGWEACTVAWVCLSRRLAPLCQNQRPELGERNIHLDLANSLVPGPIRYPNPMVYPMKICQNSLLMFVVFPHSMFARFALFLEKLINVLVDWLLLTVGGVSWTNGSHLEIMLSGEAVNDKLACKPPSTVDTSWCIYHKLWLYYLKTNLSDLNVYIYNGL